MLLLLRFGLVTTPLPGAGAREEEVKAEPSSASPDGITLPSALITTFLLGILSTSISYVVMRRRTNEIETPGRTTASKQDDRDAQCPMRGRT